jgi:hypothetical protein
MSRITPGDVVTHTEDQIGAIVDSRLGDVQANIDEVSSNLHVVSVSVDTLNTNLTNTQNDLTTAVNDLNTAKDDLAQTQSDLATTESNLTGLQSTVTNLPKGTIVVTSLPVDPAAIGGGMTLYLDVVDPDLKGLYAWDGTQWVNPGKLLDGSVTAEKLSPGIIFSAEIEAGEITETHIADDSITTPKIRAGAVTTSKLVVGNFANLCENNDFELGDSSWTKGQGWTIVNEPTNAYNGSWVAKRAGYGTGSVISNVKFKCVPNQKYIAQANIKLGTGADGYGAVRVVTFDSSNVETVVDTGNQITASTFTMSEVLITVPSDAVNIRVEIIATNTTGYIYVDQGVLSINSLTVIEDGSITTDKLATDSVTANKIVAGAVTAAKMTVTDLSAITANMGNITAGTITLDTAGHIKGGQTAYNTGTGFWMGYDSAAYKISFGSSTQGFTWDGSGFSIKGGSININNLFTTDASGNVSIKSAASGARLEIKNNVIKVYDASNVLRVQIGDLTA